MVKEEKIKEVEELRNLIKDYSVIGILDMFKLPSRQLQEINKKIRGEILIKVTKKSTLKFAIKGLDKTNLNEVEKFIPKQPGIILTNMEPFKFYLMVNKMKSFGPAKEGDIAPKDILIPAGPTSLLPGPVISELNKAGIPVGIEEGKVTVKKDTIIVKKGGKISKEIAIALRKLGIQPIEIGLNVIAVYHNGVIYEKDVLSLVGDTYLDKLKKAYNESLNLSIAICYPTKDNIKMLLTKAFNNTRALENKFGGVK